MSEASLAESERCTEVIQRIVRPDSRIYTLTTYGRGETDYVRVFVVDSGEIQEITYYVARAVGARKLDKRGWPFRGGQYSKGLEAADWVARIAGFKFDQHNWTEL